MSAAGFDPRTAPVVYTDGDLPPVPWARLQPPALRARFAASPSWTPEIVRERPLAAHTPVDAAVLVGIVQHAEPTVLLTERTAHLSNHAGQIAFPGGRTDPSDADAVATALREAWEEVGLEARHAEVLGTLPIYRTGTAFVITPVVALLAPSFALRPHAYEVADVFEVPLRFLMDPANHRRHAAEIDGVQREWFSMPYVDGQGKERFIWGATAGMLRNLYRFLGT
jgi:8-oxo-dGTP pyrophosphatase MutT (NUDIX family)